MATLVRRNARENLKIRLRNAFWKRLRNVSDRLFGRVGAPEKFWKIWVWNTFWKRVRNIQEVVSLIPLPVRTPPKIFYSFFSLPLEIPSKNVRMAKIPTNSYISDKFLFSFKIPTLWQHCIKQLAASRKIPVPDRKLFNLLKKCVNFSKIEFRAQYNRSTKIRDGYQLRPKLEIFF
jgi:hypothetical protein